MIAMTATTWIVVFLVFGTLCVLTGFLFRYASGSIGTGVAAAILVSLIVPVGPVILLACAAVFGPEQGWIWALSVTAVLAVGLLAYIFELVGHRGAR